MESEAYLEPGFDPNTLKVAELRGILLKYDVDYPSSAKKSVLLELFNQHVASRAQKLRTASARVKPSTEGMIDAGFTPEKNDIHATPARRPRRTTRGVTEDHTEEDDDAPPKSTRKPHGRASSRRRTVDVEPVQDENQLPPSAVRKPRKSMTRLLMDEVATPYRKVEPEESDTPFSSYNPFQMGSPPMPIKSPDPERRRTVGVPASAKKPSGTLRRRTEGVPVEVFQQPEPDYPRDGTLTKRRNPIRTATNGSQRTNNGASERTKYSIVMPEPDAMEPGEEFSPQEAAELAQEPPRELVRRNSRRPSGTGSNILLVTVSFILMAYAIWWRAEKIEVGYCGVGGLDMRSYESDNPLLELIRPDCEPCPPHARCYPGMELDCVDDYIKVNSWLSLGGLWPIPPACVPDTEKERRAMIMSDAALDILRKSGAEQRCKEKFLSGGMDLEGVSEADLRQVLYDRKAPALSDREFSELWRHALEDLSNREEVIVDTDTDGNTKLKSTSLAALPFGCAARLFIAGSVARYRVEIIGMIFLLLAGVVIRSTLAHRKTYQSKVTKLVHIALSQLAVYAIQHPDHPYVAVPHLRDQVLQYELDPKKRRHLWEGVEKVVEQNTNVRAGEREVQGEIMRVWTWIGGRFVEGKSVFNENDAPRQDLEWRNVPKRPVV